MSCCGPSASSGLTPPVGATARPDTGRRCSLAARVVLIARLGSLMGVPLGVWRPAVLVTGGGRRRDCAVRVLFRARLDGSIGPSDGRGARTRRCSTTWCCPAGSFQTDAREVTVDRETQVSDWDSKLEWNADVLVSDQVLHNGAVYKVLARTA